jgi:hypothetical protein
MKKNSATGRENARGHAGSEKWRASAVNFEIGSDRVSADF